MKKISNFIILFSFMILYICSVITPTFCATRPPDNTYTIQQGVAFDKGQNYYNENNLKYVSINGIELSRKNDIVCFINPSTWTDGLRNLCDTTYLDVQDLYIYHYGEPIFIGTLSVEYQFFTQTDNFFYIKQLSYSYESVPFNVPLDLYYKDWGTINLTIPFVPFDHFIDYLTGDIGMNIWQVWDFSYTIDYNGQYFYNDYFGISLFHDYPFRAFYFDTIRNPKREIILTDNNNCEFVGTFTGDDVFDKNHILFENRYNYESSYISKVRLNDTFNDMTYYQIYESLYKNKYYFSDTFQFNVPDTSYVEGNECRTLYSANSKGQDTLGSTLIPIGGNEFYKNGAWYDIPTHLYNFIIYLTFDAPLLSDLFRLFLVIINFIFSLFSFLIGLFAGFESVFFVSIFVGFIVLIFLLKIIFKG